VNNLNDALAWVLVPLFLAAEGASPGRIGLVAALYPAVWGLGQIYTGHVSDRIGRKPLIVAGMLVQAGALGLLGSMGGTFGMSVTAAAVLGVGTALVYPTLIAAVSDVVQPRDRAGVVGVYRFWRDTGFVLGALLAGIAADVSSAETAILVVAAVTAASGLVVTATPWQGRAKLAPVHE
jgi:MFS family permease